jgi:tetratricopeptide (TPR) repeat protein
MGEAYQTSGDLDRAEKLYPRALDIHSSAGSLDSGNAVEARNNLAELYRLQGKDDAADALLGGDNA